MSLNVFVLNRIRVMNIPLDGLRPGQYREITGKEKADLYRAAGMGNVGKGIG